MQIFNESLEDYMLVKRAVEGCSPKTEKTYRYALKSFIDFYDGSSPIDAQLVRRYQAHLYHRELKPTSQRLYLTAARKFFEYLVREGKLEEDPTRGIVFPKKSNKLPDCFSREQVNALLRCCQSYTWPGMRNKAAIALMAGTGLRVGEVSALTLASIDLEKRTIFVREGKGGKDRVVYADERLTKVLSKWLTMRAKLRFVKPGNRFLFVTRFGTQLSGMAFYKVMQDLAQQAGITGVRCSPHTLRHTFASNYLASGGSIYNLSRLLGHTNLKTTEKYLHSNDEAIKAEVEKIDLLKQFELDDEMAD